MNIIEKARYLRAKIEALAVDMTDADAYDYPDLFAGWKNEKDYKTGDRVRYNSVLYKCLQDHTSQADWTPDKAVSLWAEVPDPALEWPEWKQPTGAHDAYAKGAKVSHSDKHWVSDIDANVYEPGVYGWTEQ